MQEWRGGSCAQTQREQEEADSRGTEELHGLHQSFKSFKNTTGVSGCDAKAVMTSLCLMTRGLVSRASRPLAEGGDTWVVSVFCFPLILSPQKTTLQFKKEPFPPFSLDVPGTICFEGITVVPPKEKEH